MNTIRQMFGYFVDFAAFLAVWSIAITLVVVAAMIGCLVGVISPITSAVILAVMAVFFAIKATLSRQWRGVTFWLLTLGSGSIAATFGPGSLAAWGLVVGTITSGILFAIPAAFSLGARSTLRVLLVIQLVLSLALVAREMSWVAGGWAAFAVIVLLALAFALGSGSYRPREMRRVQRLASRWAILAAAALLLWQPVITPTVQWLIATGHEVQQTVASSPLGSWYSAIAARAERAAIGEAAKTAALRDLRGDLQRSYQERWRKGIHQIPSLPLSPGEWGDLAIPRESDP